MKAAFQDERTMRKVAVRGLAFAGGLVCLSVAVMAQTPGGLAVPSGSLPSGISAQALPALPAELSSQLNRLQQQQQQQQQQQAQDALQGQPGEGRDQGQQSNARRQDVRQADPVSAVEQFYGKRLSDQAGGLRQFGYEALRSSGGSGSFSGAAPDDYVMGVGDEIIVSLRGQVNRTLSSRVNREGMVILEGLAPVPGANRTLADVRRDLESQIAQAYLKTDSFISLGRVRSISVILTGEVGSPGFRNVSSLSSLTGTLAEAGIRRTGSLRNITLIRNGESRRIDLYDILLGRGKTSDLLLQEGDQIQVHPLGQTIAVIGSVGRPGIYELPPGTQGMAARGMIDLAGGLRRAQGNRFLLMRLDRSARDTVRDQGSDKAGFDLQPNDILRVELPSEVVSVEGNVGLAGERSLLWAPSLRSLITSPAFLESDPYLPLAFIQTENPVTRLRRYVPVDLNRVISGALDYKLQPLDRVIILSRNDIRFLASADVQAVLTNRPPPSFKAGAAASASGNAGIPGGCTGLRVLGEVLAGAADTRFLAALKYVRTVNVALPNIRSCPAVFDAHPDLLPLVLEYSSLIEGEVRIPGLYPALPGASLDSVVAAAGGLTLEADTAGFEIMTGADGRLSRHALAEMSALTFGPGDSLRFNQRPNEQEIGVITLAGEFQRPGRFAIRRGEKLSELIRRAGGLSPQAYPYGAVFTRQRVREAEAQANDRAARELERAIPQLLASSKDPAALGATVTAVQQLIQSIRSTPAVGRVVVESDPTVLAARPEMDFVLEAGDVLAVPKRPNHVSVTGDVLNPSSVMFISGRPPEDYIKLAGGVTQTADKGKAFIIYPNGESAPLGLNSWSGSDLPVPPGSFIVIPRDSAPLDYLGLTKDVISLVSSIALSAASLAVISK